jgi:hypothetical protein
MADDMCHVIVKLSLKARARFKPIEKVLDCIADNGYVNDTEEKQKEMQNMFKSIVKHLIRIVYDQPTFLGC